MHDVLAENVPKYAKEKRVGRRELSWSGKHTLALAKEAGQLADLHSLAFDYASAFVHPSAIFLLTTLSQSDQGGNVVQVSIRSQDQQAIEALRIAHDPILNAADLRLKYSPSDSAQERLDACRQDFLRI